MLNSGQSKVGIDISADIVSILDIDEISSIFHVQFFLHYSWFDSRLEISHATCYIIHSYSYYPYFSLFVPLLRLDYYNLKADSGLNALSPEEKQEIWVPKLVFSNTENRLGTLVDDDSTITIQRGGNYSIPDISDVENRHLYKGVENKITLSRFYNIRFLCYYSMNWYPFDLQVH